MAAISAVIMLALLEYIWLSGRVGMARAKYGVEAPATSGDPIFERHYRVQVNTLEQLIIFIPAIVAFAYAAEALGWPGQEIGSVLGLIWLLGRYLYATAYVSDPNKRGPGFMLSFVPSVLMVLGTLVCLLLGVLR
ncbi:MAG: MAPEG family protein [Pseudomonadales bacterium]|nr:MAPEG family protein [Pseudomonadales bacterium]